jgi:3-dehydroquinate synthase
VNVIAVSGGARKYDVLVGSKLIDEIGMRIEARLKPSRCAVISDEKVASLHGGRVLRSLARSKFAAVAITIPPGEKSKTLAQVEAVCAQMAAQGLDRSSFVLALGGGVVGDLAGFVAAIYHRGIAHVQVPTTLLAQVDSSIGGKTAVNTAAGKNLMGAIHHPAVVITDVDLLRTLPSRELNQGFAEVIKHAIIRDPELFDLLGKFDRKDGDFELLVRRNVRLKAEFVSADERDEKGTRALLNFGHTVGHAIEWAGNYRALLHGEAVSLGIVAACDISVRKAGLPDSQRKKIVSLLERNDLPTRLPSNISRANILRALPFDKKFEKGKVRFVVTSRIGSARLTNEVSMEDVRAAVSRL